MNIELKIKRVQKQMTQNEVAKELGITTPAYSYVESGKRKGSMEMWLKLQEIFEIADEDMWKIVKHNVKGE